MVVAAMPVPLMSLVSLVPEVSDCRAVSQEIKAPGMMREEETPPLLTD